MPVDTVKIRSDVVNRSRISRGIGRMEFYQRVACDPRTGIKCLNGGRVSLIVARRLAEALQLPLTRIIDLDSVGQTTPAIAGASTG